MTAFTNYTENLILNWLMRGVGTPPAAWYAALHTADPTEAGNVGELSGNGYARQLVTFSESSASLSDNEADLLYGPNTDTDWGEVTHVSLWDAVTGGNCLIKGPLTAPIAIVVGESLKIAAGNLDLEVG